MRIYDAVTLIALLEANPTYIAYSGVAGDVPICRTCAIEKRLIILGPINKVSVEPVRFVDKGTYCCLCADLMRTSRSACF